jgi:signal transduction histidine kinase
VDITAQKQAEARLAETLEQLLVASRQAGMAEVATGVLHNVGNVLNSVNVSATLIADRIRHSKAGNIAKIAAMFDGHKADLAGFLANDPRGRTIPDYLGTLAESLAAEQTMVIAELDELGKNVDYIKGIVAMQQTYAMASGVFEDVSVPEMIEDALRINAASLARHDIEMIRDHQSPLVVTTDKHKVIEILVNLVRNAKYACDESGRAGKQITVRTASDDRGVKIAVIDNGIGIPAENLTRIFNYGFTTREHGHGFGLHSSALAAKELGGSLTVKSEGAGRGATFTLELPCKPEAKKP